MMTKAASLLTEASLNKLLREHRAMAKAWYANLRRQIADDLRTGKRYEVSDICNSEPI